MSVHVGKEIDRDLDVECDVCVIGSGAGGAHVAQRLATAGKKVVILEEGGFHPSRTFDLTEQTMLPRLYQERGLRSTADGAIGILQGRAVGGTTVVNWTTCFRTPKRVIEFWQEHHGVDGLTHEALIPHWERIEERLNIQPMTLDQVNRNNMVIWRGAKNLGWPVHLLHRNVKNCAHSGYCGVGCPVDAKQSMLVTMIPEAVRAGADLYADAWVERIEREGRKVKKVVARILDNENGGKRTSRTITVRPKLTVLAGGGINSPAVLLRSEIDANGRVGKRTFLHPSPLVMGIHEERIDGFTGSPQYVASDKFQFRGDDKMGFLLETTPVFPAMSAAAPFVHGEALQKFMDLMPHLSVMNAILSDGFDANDPDEGGTVTLRETGNPKVDYKWTARLMEGLKEATRREAEVQLAGGAREVHTLHPRPIVLRSKDDLKLLDGAKWGPLEVGVFSAHVMGGCPMGKDPKRAVVDSSTLRHHELDDLFIVDGSVYPTSLRVNPQLSIYGLASWASEHVKAALG